MPFNREALLEYGKMFNTYKETLRTAKGYHQAASVLIKKKRMLEELARKNGMTSHPQIREIDERLNRLKGLAEQKSREVRSLKMKLDQMNPSDVRIRGLAPVA